MLMNVTPGNHASVSMVRAAAVVPIIVGMVVFMFNLAVSMAVFVIASQHETHPSKAIAKAITSRR